MPWKIILESSCLGLLWLIFIRRSQIGPCMLAWTTSSGPAGHSPSCRPRCCVCSWPSGRLAGSLGHLRIPGTPARRSRHPRCIPPISSHLLEVLCGGSHSRRSWTCPQHRSASRRRPPLPRRWHGQRRTLAWLGINRVHGIISQRHTFVFLPNLLQHHLNLMNKQEVILLIF